MFKNYWYHRYGVSIHRKWWQLKYRATYSNLTVKGDTPRLALYNLENQLVWMHGWIKDDAHWMHGIRELKMRLGVDMLENSSKIEEVKHKRDYFGVGDTIDEVFNEVGNKCHKCKTGPARIAHVCPWKHELKGDTSSLCTCCNSCTRECAMDV